MVRHKVELLLGPLFADPHYAIIFAVADDRQMAEQMARDFVISRGWSSVGFFATDGPILRDHVQHGASMLSSYEQALREGVGGEFYKFDPDEPAFE